MNDVDDGTRWLACLAIRYLLVRGLVEGWEWNQAKEDCGLYGALFISASLLPLH